jgi:hypothetical protein
MKRQADNKGRLWKHMAIASLLLPVCGFVFASFGPGWIGKPYFMVGLHIGRLSGWPWACSVAGLLASGAALFMGGLGLYGATVMGPTYVSPSYITNEAQLAEVPESTSYVNSLHRNCIGERWYFLKFLAPPEDIDAFIRTSPSLKQPPYAVFDVNNVHTPFRLSIDQRVDLEADDRRYMAYSMAPRWFRPDITVKGRQYDFKTKDRWGIIVVDDDKNEVYVFLAWGDMNLGGG